MERKIFNSYKSRVKMNLEFKRFYWGTRSLHNKSLIGASIIAALSATTIPPVTFLFFLYVQFDECLFRLLI